MLRRVFGVKYLQYIVSGSFRVKNPDAAPCEVQRLFSRGWRYRSSLLEPRWRGEFADSGCEQRPWRVG